MERFIKALEKHPEDKMLEALSKEFEEELIEKMERKLGYENLTREEAIGLARKYELEIEFESGRPEMKRKENGEFYFETKYKVIIKTPQEKALENFKSAIYEERYKIIIYCLAVLLIAELLIFIYA